MNGACRLNRRVQHRLRDPETLQQQVGTGGAGPGRHGEVDLRELAPPRARPAAHPSSPCRALRPPPTPARPAASVC
ncbi:hypothetical protein EJB05_12595 [Eragrostis curvula]|uniref:Uncharacterized protein n=1 Tax=Eragrostis curvula TaxID=38414 RepID=A0A5J9VTK3_9POAL|nr:hypothetical protein EJB05_12595 [Eragrostis curvula]